MDSDEMDIDPALAEAMGFSGFGMQNKKRKHGDEDAFTAASSQPQESSSQTQGARPEGGQGRGSRGKQSTTTAGAGSSHAASAQAAVAVDADGMPTLEALRHGVKNAQGDMVYFLPSFVEDPWEKLKRGR